MVEYHLRRLRPRSSAELKAPAPGCAAQTAQRHVTSKAMANQTHFPEKN